MGRRRFQKKQQKQDTGKRLRVNEQIRKSPVRLVDENNEQVGVIETAEAQKKARNAELDLVEVAPQADPPVCRIMDYGKWKYQQQKKEQKAKAHAKQSEVKEVRLRPGTGEHDLNIKIERAERFLKEGHKVQFTILFRGRQMAHRDIGFELFDEIAERFEEIGHVEQEPKVQGRRMTMLMSHGTKRGGTKSKPDPEKQQGKGSEDAGGEEGSGGSSAEQPSSSSQSPQHSSSQ